MRLVSTSGGGPEIGFRDALFRSMAADGGLFAPAELPRIEPETWRALAGADLPEIGRRLMVRLLGDELEADAIRRAVTEALDFPVPLVQLDDDLWVLELFHGPTLAFKDVGARFMARMMAACRPGAGVGTSGADDLTILAATSGDTGSAVAHAFLGVPGTRIVVLFPDGQVSRLQERQFTTLGDNVTALAVQGTFDDCQRLAKAAFADADLCRTVNLTSANSINIGRLLPQLLYYVAAWAALPDDGRPLVFCTPSGNFGNLTAGLYAGAMGLPVDGYVAATNINDVVPEYLATGELRTRPSARTISNAMDVGDPSNLARIIHLFDGDLEAMRGRITGVSFDDDATRTAIAEVHRRSGRVLCPHTAVGWLGLRQALDRRRDGARGVLLATAHPAKFGDTVEEATGEEVPLPERLAACLERPRRATPIAPELDAVRAVLLER